MEKEGKFAAEPRGGATARSATQKAAEQHGSTDSRDEDTPTLEQEEHDERRSDDGNLAATDLCEDVLSVELQPEFRSRAAVLEHNPAFNLSPGKTQAPPVPFHSLSGPSLHPPAYSQPPPAYSHPPYSHAHIPLCYPYLQGNSHPYHHPYPHPQQVHPPQQPQAGHLPQQHNHEHAQVVYQFLGTVQNPVFIGHQTSINGNVAHEERVQAVYIILLETNKGMSNFTLLHLIKHVIDLLVNIMPNFRQISFDLATLYYVSNLDSVKLFLGVKNIRGANKILALDGKNVFGVTLRASLTATVDEDAVSVAVV